MLLFSLFLCRSTAGLAPVEKYETVRGFVPVLDFWRFVQITASVDGAPDASTMLQVKPTLQEEENNSNAVLKYFPPLKIECDEKKPITKLVSWQKKSFYFDITFLQTDSPA